MPPSEKILLSIIMQEPWSPPLVGPAAQLSKTLQGGCQNAFRFSSNVSVVPRICRVTVMSRDLRGVVHSPEVDHGGCSSVGDRNGT